MKKHIALMIITELLLLIMPLMANADIVASGTCGDNLTWTLDSNGLLTISGKGKMKSYTQDWSDAINGCETNAEWGTKRITRIVIEQGVTSIGDSAFTGSIRLESVEIPDSVESIGYYAFRDCRSLKHIDLPKYLTTIKPCAFYNCSSLSSIIIPESVTSDFHNTFTGCTGLSNIVLPSNIKKIDYCSFYDCSSLKSIVIPEGVTHIGTSAFSSCENLESIILPDGLKKIGERAFNGCTKLNRITIPRNVTYIGGGALNRSSIEVVCLQDPTVNVTLEGDLCLPIDKNSTIYCYKDSSIDRWAADKECNIVYLDEYDTSIIRTMSMPDDFQLEIGETKKIRPIMFPDDHHDIDWTSSESNIVSVDIDGTVTPHTLGNVTITASIGSITDSVEITVVPHVTHRLIFHERTEATCTDKGIEEYWTCSFCNKLFSDSFGYTEINSPTEIPVIPHKLSVHGRVKPTCVETGTEKYWDCAVCKKLFSDQNGEFEIDNPVVIPVNVSDSGHQWTEPVYTLSDDHLTLTAFHACALDSSHQESETVEIIDVSMTKEPTCIIPGETTYTSAAFNCPRFVEQAIVLADIPALGHTPAVASAVEATCTSTGLTQGSYCSVCGTVLVSQRTVSKKPHTLGMVERVAPTCTEYGAAVHWKCSECGKLFKDSNGTIEISSPDQIAAAGHAWMSPTYTWAPDNSTVTGMRVCSRDSDHIETETVTVSRTIYSPTERRAGSYIYISENFLNPAFSVQRKNGNLPMIGSMDVMILPDSLQEIQEEAFSKQACEAVIVPRGCKVIGKRAFAECPHLFYAMIPEDAQVAEDAFDGCSNVIVDYRNYDLPILTPTPKPTPTPTPTPTPSPTPRPTPTATPSFVWIKIYYNIEGIDIWACNQGYKVGTQTVHPPEKTLNLNYDLIDMYGQQYDFCGQYVLSYPSSYTVTVYENGTASPDEVHFYFERSGSSGGTTPSPTAGPSAYDLVNLYGKTISQVNSALGITLKEVPVSSLRQYVGNFFYVILDSRGRIDEVTYTSFDSRYTLCGIYPGMNTSSISAGGILKNTGWTYSYSSGDTNYYVNGGHTLELKFTYSNYIERIHYQ